MTRELTNGATGWHAATVLIIGAGTVAVAIASASWEWWRPIEEPANRVWTPDPW